MKELGASLAGAVQQQPEIAALIAVGVAGVIIVLLLVLFVLVLTMGRRQARLLRGADGQNLEVALQKHMEATEATRQGIDRALKLADDNTVGLNQCLQRVGMVRYDAFPDIGGEQSFSVALLDNGSNGIVLTGIHSRHDVRIYAKSIIAGDSAVMLTAEERKAITSAATSGQAGTSGELRSPRVAGVRGSGGRNRG